MHFNRFAVIATMGLVLLASCSKEDDSGNPASYVDRYSVKLLEPEGTAYTGDYFPLLIGITRNYEGDAIMRTQFSAPGMPAIDTTMYLSIIGMQQVLPVRSLTLSGQTYALNPVMEYTEMNGSPTFDTSRFFMKDDQAVYIKAIKNSNGSYTEVTDPVFFKKTLVVGDQWKTCPRVDMANLMAGETGSGLSNVNMTLDAVSKFFVAGNENIDLPIGTRRAMRLEQANDIKLSGSMISDGTKISIAMSAKLSIVYHVIADTGIVQQNVTGPLTISMSAQGEKVTIVITFQKCEMGLKGIAGFSYSMLLKTASKTSEFGKQPRLSTPFEATCWNMSQQISRTILQQISF